MDIESLKKVWKEQQTTSFNKEQILGMLKKKSSSVAKWIFYISVTELLLGIFLNFILPSSNYDTKLPSIVIDYLDIFLYVNYFFILVFIFWFFRNYKKIKAKSTISDLLQNILKTRKTVNYYILYNIIVFGISLILTSYWVISENLPMLGYNDSEDKTAYMVGIVIGMFLIVSIALGVMYLFYRLLYGFLLRRLKNNYKEIQQLQ